MSPPPNYSIVLSKKEDSEKDDPIFRALRGIFHGCWDDTAAEEAEGESTDDILEIGIVVPVTTAQSDSEDETKNKKSDWAERGAVLLRAHPKCRGLVVADQDLDSICNKFQPHLRSAFKDGIRFEIQANETTLASLCRSIASLRDRLPATASMDRVREIVYASELYGLIELFGHGATKDITNQVLAPLRILLQGNGTTSGLSANWKKNACKLLGSFQTIVIENDKYRDDWWLSAALKEAFGDFGKKDHHPWAGNAETPAVRLDRLDRVMSLLTECRTLAGMEPGASNSASGIVKPLKSSSDDKSDPSWSYEVLVIDDHAEAWQPVFEKLQQNLANGTNGEKIPVTFEFLTGVEHSDIDTALAELLSKLPDYDAILLDIHLSPKLNGTRILKEVRRHYVNLPIIIWTSSRSSELPAKAQLAHGYLFKKTVTLENMAKLLLERLREGNAKRRYPIPGHFFDHSIRSRKNRKAALRFAEYGSKQLDSFHALDENYFRFFTDHGGRHVIKLLEYLECLLRPLIRDSCVFSSTESVREEEILALYLGVFLHEFGMLRLKGKGEPDWDSLNNKTRGSENELVRGLHALRGMIMLADPDCKHWPDEEGQYQAKKRFFSDSDTGDTQLQLVSAVALITGYHSRLLPIDEKEVNSFCKWPDQASLNIGKKTAKALGCWDKSNEGKSCKEAFKRISSRFFNQGQIKDTLEKCLKAMCNDRLERLRRQCALFRFADAIDVDHTRNPADFLSLSKSVSIFDRREALKRQVIRSVRADGGRIVFYACVPKPDIALVKKIVGNGYPDPAHPWEGEWTIARIEYLQAHQDKIDAFLADFWDNPTEQAKSLDLNICSDGKLTFDSKLAIASLTALSVAWETADEYDAIIKSGLKKVIRLCEFRWREECPREKLEKMLTILFHENGLDRLCQGRWSGFLDRLSFRLRWIQGGSPTDTRPFL